MDAGIWMFYDYQYQLLVLFVWKIVCLMGCFCESNVTLSTNAYKHTCICVAVDFCETGADFSTESEYLP